MTTATKPEDGYYVEVLRDYRGAAVWARLEDRNHDRLSAWKQYARLGLGSERSRVVNITDGQREVIV